MTNQDNIKETLDNIKEVHETPQEPKSTEQPKETTPEISETNMDKKINKRNPNIEKRKRVVVIGNNTISTNYEKVVDILFGSRTNIIKRRSDEPTFRKMTFDPKRTGIIWFRDVDYINLIKDIERYKQLDQILVFEGRLQSLEEQSARKVLDQLISLNNVFKFKKGQAYIVIPVNNLTEERPRIAELIEFFAKDCPFLERIQLELNPEIPEFEAVQKIGYLTTIAIRNGIKLNAAGYPLFHEKNDYIGHDPNISAVLMEQLLGEKMTKTRDVFNEDPNCADHKHINIIGTGEEFDPAIHKLRGGKSPSKAKKAPKPKKKKETTKKKTCNKKKKEPAKKKDPFEDVIL